MIYKECGKDAPTPDDIDKKITDFNKCVQGYLDRNKDKIAQFKKKVRQGSERIPIRKQPSKTQDMLTQYLQNRFDEKVRGKDQEKRIVNHADYFRFYQSQLSQLVTITLNSYCMNTDTEDFVDIWNRAKKAGETFKEHIEGMTSPPSLSFPLLPKGEQRNNAFEKNKILLKDPEMAANFIGICATGITNACHKIQRESDSKMKACSVLATLRKLNRAITNNEKRLKYLSCSSVKDPSRCDGFSLQKFPDSTTGKSLELYNPHIPGQSIDDLTSLTASEFQENIVEKIEQVCQNHEKPSKQCLEHLRVIAPDQLAGQDEQDKKVLAEFQIQTLIVKNSIGNESSDQGYSKEEVIAEVAAEGGVEKVIAQIKAKNDLEIKKLRAKMQQRYETERMDSLKQLAERLQKRKKNTSHQDIIQSIKDKNQALGQLLFFNNIITGYLTVKDHEQRSKGRNLSSFKREIEQVRTTTKQKFPIDLQEDFIQELEELLPKLEQEGDTSSSRKPTAHNPTFSPGEIHKNILRDAEVYELEDKNDSD